MMAGKMPPTETPKFVFIEEHFLNRELSWLAFNSRVLDEAARADLPVLERVKFIAITASNLDEFFMVRVGGLQAMREQGKRVKDNAGLTPTQQWDQIQQQAGAFVARQYDILNGQLLPLLREKGIRDDYIVLVGGAPLNEDFARQIGADAYCRDAAIAVQTAREMIARRQDRPVAG